MGVFKNGESGDAIAHAHNYKQFSSNLSLANHKKTTGILKLYTVFLSKYFMQKDMFFWGGGGK